MVEKTAEADMRYSSQCTFSAAWERVRLNRPGNSTTFNAETAELAEQNRFALRVPRVLR